MAVIKNNIDIIEPLLQQKNIDINVMDENYNYYINHLWFFNDFILIILWKSPVDYASNSEILTLFLDTEKKNLYTYNNIIISLLSCMLKIQMLNLGANVPTLGSK